MQFHLDGFRTGDPSVRPASADVETRDAADGLPEKVDVLIVGAGPAGLALAAQLSAFPDITTCVIERKPARMTHGQADGIACRTMEMFDAFGFSEKVAREAYWVNETTFWKPNPASPTGIARAGRILDTPEGLSPFPHVILNQARIHDFFLEVMANSAHRLEPFYARDLQGLKIDGVPDALDRPLDLAGADSYPVMVTVERTDDEHAGQIETVRARFVVGCDGARSSVRRALGLKLEGVSANQAWGVMDVLAVTDFPDIRLKTAIHSQREGSILIIPREGGYLTRLYIEQDELGEHERVADRGITIDKLIASAKRILNPYRFDVKEVAWWSVYEIGQRLCPQFDNLAPAEASARIPRVFIAGDACHTHSPKAGQGMNVSMQDSFNLGWKLASVLRGRARPRLLQTYARERYAVAKELIDFDKDMARLFSAQPKDPDNPEAGGIDPAEFQRFFEAQGRFTAGTATHYAPSLITGSDAHQALATGYAVGMRFHSAPVVRVADAKPMELGEVLQADGRWRLVIFAPREAPEDPASALHAVCRFLADDPRSPLRRYARNGDAIDATFDVRAVLQAYHRDVAIERLPTLLVPTKGRYGLVDYEKVFSPALDQTRDIFDMRGIDRERGCLVIVRPDQYVADVLPIDKYDAVAKFFEKIMVPNLTGAETDRHLTTSRGGEA